MVIYDKESKNINGNILGSKSPWWNVPLIKIQIVYNFI